jgi:hypothetical protein
MSGFDYYGAGAEEMTAEQLNALDEVHGKMTHDIADAHLTGNKFRAEQVAGYRRTVSEGLSGGDPAVEPAAADLYGYDRNDREDLEDRRRELTHELHEAVANKDSSRAERLDRERNEYTDELYGNGDIVGAGGRSL